MRAPSGAHRYRHKLSGSVAVLLLTAPLNAIVVALVGYGILKLAQPAVSIIREGSSFEAILFGVFTFVVVIPLLLIPAGGQICVLLLKVGRPFLSYVDVTPGSLEARIWPSYRVRCRWEDVERMGKNPNWGASYHVLSLKQAEPLEENTLTVILGRLPGWFSARSQYSVPLNSFRGYPTGDFADDLRCYAPHLFVPEAESIGNHLA